MIKKRLLIALCFAVLLLTACSPPVTVSRRLQGEPAGTLELTLYSFDGESERVFGIPVLGHAFISLKNGGASSVYIYGYEIQPGEETTVGAWGQSELFGIWFNVEAHYMSVGRYAGIVSLTQRIDSGVLPLFSEYIKDNDTWTPQKNCSFFAVTLWNMANSKNAIEINGLTTPAKLKTEMLLFETSERNRKVTPVKDAAYKKDGEFIYCPMAD